MLTSAFLPECCSPCEGIQVSYLVSPDGGPVSALGRRSRPQGRQANVPPMRTCLPSDRLRLLLPGFPKSWVTRRQKPSWRKPTPQRPGQPGARNKAGGSPGGVAVPVMTRTISPAKAQPSSHAGREGGSGQTGVDPTKPLCWFGKFQALP